MILVFLCFIDFLSPLFVNDSSLIYNILLLVIPSTKIRLDFNPYNLFYNDQILHNQENIQTSIKWKIKWLMKWNYTLIIYTVVTLQLKVLKTFLWIFVLIIFLNKGLWVAHCYELWAETTMMRDTYVRLISVLPWHIEFKWLTTWGRWSTCLLCRNNDTKWCWQGG